MRLSRPVRRRRPNRSAKVTVGLFAVLVGACLVGLWTARESQDSVPLRTYYTLNLRADDLAGLVAHNEVRVAGTRVGQVLSPRIVDGSPLVEIQMDRGAGPLPADTRFVVRSKGLLGGRFLQIEPGRSRRTLPSNATVSAASASATVETPDVLNALPRRTRAHAGSLLDAAGAGLLGRGRDLNATVQRSSGLFDDLARVATSVLGRSGSAEAFLPSLGSGAAALAGARRDIAAGFAPATRALRPLGDRRAELTTALRLAPSTLAGARVGLQRTDPLLERTVALSHALRRVLRHAPAAFADTGDLLRDAPADLRRADRLLDAVPASANALADAAPPLQRELPRVDALLDAASPIAEELQPRACDLRLWANNWDSDLRPSVPGGGPIGPLHALRFQALVNPSMLVHHVPLSPNPVKKVPYPAPCTTDSYPDR